MLMARSNRMSIVTISCAIIDLINVKLNANSDL
jgi:hypothetical protein